MVGRKQGSKDGERYDERIQGRIKSEGVDGERGQDRETKGEMAEQNR